MKHRLYIILSILVILVVVGLWYNRAPLPKSPAATERKTLPAHIEKTDVKPTAEPELQVEYLKISSSALKALKSESLTMELGRTIGGLNDPRYRKEDVERALVPLLDHPNSRVRMRACGTLAEQGSSLWQPTALAILNDAIQGKVLEPVSLEAASSILMQYRAPVPKDILIALSQRFSDERMAFVSYTYDELLPWWEEPIRKGTAWNLDYFSTFRRASPDIVALIQKGRASAATRPANHFQAEFDLYRVGENPGFFPEIIKMAEIHLGRRARPPAPDYTYDIRWDTTRKAWEFVLYSDESAAIELMRSVATKLSRDPNPDSMIFGQALGALFYLHRDYAFVDKLLMDRLLAGIEHAEKTQMNIISVYELQIMAARGNPAFAPLVRKQLPEIYNYYFVQSAHVPIERWIGLPRTPHPDTRVAIKGEP